MSVLNYKCTSTIYNIEILDDILELLLKHNQIDWYRDFCFAAHELLINSVEAMSRQINEDNTLYIEICIDSDLVTFSVSDTGGGLKKKISDVLTEYDFSNMEDHGRGLLMIHSLVDNFIIEEESYKKYKYTIVKKRIVPIESEDI